jgi:FkbM family methyltransferase
MKASSLRKITQLLPLPNSIMSSIEANNEIIYPNFPVIVPTKEGFQIEIKNAREFMQKYMYFRGFYEFRITSLIKKILRTGDTFIDIGANIGWYTLLGAKLVGKTGQVITFEPAHHIYKHLKRNIDINSFKNIFLEKIAISDREDTVLLHTISNENIGLGSIIQSPTVLKQSLKTETVKTARLENYLKEKSIEKIRLIKIDVEGAEMKVLEGTREILKNKLCDYLIVEVSDERLRSTNSSSNELFALLRDNGYKLSQIRLFKNKPLSIDSCARHSTSLTMDIFAELIK